MAQDDVKVYEKDKVLLSAEKESNGEFKIWAFGTGEGTAVFTLSEIEAMKLRNDLDRAIRRKK